MSAAPPQFAFDEECAQLMRQRRLEEERREIDAICRRHEEHERRRRLLRLGLSEDSEGPEPPLSAKLLAEMRSSRGRGAYIHGDVGRGKTYLASAMVRAWDGEGTAHLVREVEFLSMLRSCYRGHGDLDAVMREVKGYGLLAFDDLGKSAPTDWSVALVYEVVDWRTSRLLPTVYTSNYRLAELQERLSGQQGQYAETARAICSRIAGTCLDCPMGGPDRRLA